VKPKTHHFQTISQANARTARWPWLFVLGFWLLLRNLIIGWFSHSAPIPTAQQTIPRRKPLRCSADWELRLTGPSHCWHSIARVLCLSLLFGRSVFAADLSSSAFDQRAVANLSASILNGVARTSAGMTDERGVRVTNYTYKDSARSRNISVQAM
jgi:hypothetical protein